jgi:hypothetical protein
MPLAFNTYPALAIRQPDLGKTLITAAYLKSAKLKNQLTQAKLQKLKLVQGLGAQVMGTSGVAPSGGTAGPGDQLAGAAGGAGGVASPMIDAASPAMRELMAADPEVGSQYLNAITKMNEEQRKQYKRVNGITARLLLMVEDVPEEQRPMVYAQALQKARQEGVSVNAAPPQYDQQWVQNQLRVAMALDDELTAVERKARTEGVWVQTAKGRRFQRFDKMEEGEVIPNAPGADALTKTQVANNIEIDSARRGILAMGLGREELLGRATSAAHLGRKNVDYDPLLARALNKALQRKTGDDSGYADFHRRFALRPNVPPEPEPTYEEEEPAAPGGGILGLIKRGLGSGGQPNDLPLDELIAGPDAATKDRRGFGPTFEGRPIPQPTLPPPIVGPEAYPGRQMLPQATQPVARQPPPTAPSPMQPPPAAQPVPAQGAAKVTVEDVIASARRAYKRNPSAWPEIARRLRERGIDPAVIRR